MNTPFSNVRWEQGKDIPFVFVNKKWWILSSVQNIDAAVLVRDAKEKFGPEMYQQALSENFTLLVPAKGPFMDIDLEDIETSEVESVSVALRASLEGTPEYVAKGATPNQPPLNLQDSFDDMEGTTKHQNTMAGGDVASMQMQMKKQALMQCFGTIMQFGKQGLGMSLLDMVSAYESVGGKIVGVNEEDEDGDDGSHEM